MTPSLERFVSLGGTIDKFGGWRRVGVLERELDGVSSSATVAAAAAAAASAFTFSNFEEESESTVAAAAAGSGARETTKTGPAAS